MAPPSMEEWEKDARGTIASYYRAFGGHRWDQYDLDEEDQLLLLAKICYAMFGPPTNKEGVSKETTDLSAGYPEEQRTRARQVLDLVVTVYKEVPSKDLLVSIIFVACRPYDEAGAPFVVPLMVVFEDGDPTNAESKRRFVDTFGRTYKNWNDWLENNTLPKVRCCYPVGGYFSSCTKCHCYEFDEDKEPDMRFRDSPACSVVKTIFNVTDIVTGITGLVVGGVTIAAMFTPLAPAVMLTCAITGSSCGVYGVGRAVTRLVDKGTHDESLTDLESFTLWFSVAAAPLHFTTGLMNASLVRGATVNGRIFSSSTRMFATILNFSTLGVDAVLLSFGVANLVEKAKKDSLTPLDVLQFSMSVFFFTNTLIQPQMASRIIEQAQDAHIQQYAASMSDGEAQASFQRFLDTNKGTGSITDKSKIVRTINRIQDPNRVFGGLKGATKIEIGGRRGKTLLVTDQNLRTNRIQPNRTLFTNARPLQPVNYQAEGRRTVEDCLGRNPDEVQHRGKNIFAEANLDDRQKHRVNRVIKNTAHGNRDVLETSLQLADMLQYDSVDDVLSVVEIVTQEVYRRGVNRDDAIRQLRANMTDFAEGIRADVAEAGRIAAQRGDVNFVDDLNAVYHYRKHGNEFPARVGQSPIEVYLCDVPDRLVRDANLVQVDQLTTPGMVRKMYLTPNDRVVLVVESPNVRRLTTAHHNPNIARQYRNSLAQANARAVPVPEFLTGLRQLTAFNLGFYGPHLNVTVYLDDEKDAIHFCSSLQSPHSIDEELWSILSKPLN